MPTLLRLVGQGQGTDPPRRRKGAPSPALSLSDNEARAVRAAARNIARNFGGIGKLAAALDVDPSILRALRPSPAVAVALARISGMSVDTVLGRTGLASVPDDDRGDPAGMGGAGEA